MAEPQTRKEYDTQSNSGLTEFLADIVKAESAKREQSQPIIQEKSINQVEKTSEVLTEQETSIESNTKLTPEAKIEELKKIGIESESPEQIKIRELTESKAAIEADLKLTKEEKTKALEALESTQEKHYWENEEKQSNGEQKDTNTPVADKAKEFEAKAKEYEDILKDPAVEAIISARKAGKDFTTFLKEVAPIDIDKIPLAELMREQLKREGLSPEAIESEMEEFGEMKERVQKLATREIKATLQAEQQNRLQKYTLDNKQATLKRQEAFVKLKQEKDQYINSIKDKKQMGLEMTPTLLKELSEDFDKFSLIRTDGTYDAPKIMEVCLLLGKHKLMMQNAYNKGRAEEALESWKKNHRPSATNGFTAAPSSAKKEGAEKEQATISSGIEKMHGRA